MDTVAAVSGVITALHTPLERSSANDVEEEIAHVTERVPELQLPGRALRVCALQRVLDRYASQLDGNLAAAEVPKLSSASSASNKLPLCNFCAACARRRSGRTMARRQPPCVASHLP